MLSRYGSPRYELRDGFQTPPPSTGLSVFSKQIGPFFVIAGAFGVTCKQSRVRFHGKEPYIMRHLRFEQLESRQMMATDLAWSVDTPYERGHGLVSDGENVYISTANTGNVIKYDANGNEVWSWDMGNDGSVAYNLYVDGDHLYVVYSPSYNTHWTAKLTLDGDVVWNEAAAINHINNGYAVSWDGSNHGGIVRIDDPDTVLWTLPTDRTAATMVATDDGIFVGGHCDLGGYVTKYDLSGNEIWTHNFMGDPEAAFGTEIHVVHIVAAPNGVYFYLRAENGLTIDGDTYQGIYNMDHHATGLLVEDDVVWYRMNGKYGELQSIDGILFIDGAGYGRDGNLMYAIDPPGKVEIIRADQHSFSAVFYHWDENLTRYDYTPNDPGQIEIETMGFVDPPAASYIAPSYSTADVPSSVFDAALYSAFADYWAEQGESEDLTKKRRAA
jgi:hypothetical protein